MNEIVRMKSQKTNDGNKAVRAGNCVFVHTPLLRWFSEQNNSIWSVTAEALFQYLIAAQEFHQNPN